MQREITRGAAADAGLIFHVFVQDSTSTVGAGKTGLAYSAFSCRYVRNGETISAAITAQDITTLGTYQAPTANTNIRIKLVDDTNMPGIYEVHIHQDWVNTTNSCQSLTIYLSAAGAAVLPIQIPLVGWNPQDAVRGGMTALPAAAADAAGGLPISDAGGLDLDTLLGRLDAAMSSRAAAATALSNATWTDAKAAFLDAAMSSRAAAATALSNAVWTDAKAAFLDALISSRSTITEAQVNAQCDSALADYDAPTNAEMLAAFAALNDLSSAEAQAACAAAVAAYDGPTHAELDADFAIIAAAITALNDITAAEAAAAVFAYVVENSKTFLQLFRRLCAAEFGKTSGMDTAAGKCRSLADDKDRISATLDGAGNRTAMAFDDT